MSTPSIQPDEETMRRNLAITLANQPPPANPLEPQMAAPGPIDLPNQPKAPDMSIFPASKPPVVFGPFGQGGKGMAQRGTPEGDKQEIQRLSSTGSGVSQIPGRIESAMPNHPVLGKVLGQGAGILGRIGDAILSNLPGSLNGVGKGIESMIPGTQGYHQAQLGQATGQLNNETTNAEKEAQAADIKAQAPLRAAQTTEVQERVAEMPQAAKTEQGFKEAQITNLLHPQAKTDFEAWQVQNPGKPIGDWLSEVAKAKEPTSDVATYIRDYMGAHNLPDTPENRMIAHQEYTNETKIAPAQIRIEGLAATRGMPVTDSQTGLTTPMSWEEYNQKSKAEPGRYVSPQYNPETQMGIKAWRDLSPGGKTGTQVTSYNTFLQHTGQLYDAVSELKNSGYPGWNKPLNWLRTQTGDPRVKAFLAKEEPVKKEFESFLLNNRALYSEDRADANKYLDENSSPAQMYGVLPSLIHTGFARINEQNNSFKRATGEDIPNLISPEAQKAIDRVGGNQPYGSNQPAQGGGMIRAIDDKGVLHEAPAGTALPKGWKAQ